MVEKVYRGIEYMTYSEYFSSVKTKFAGTDVSDITEHLAYQFNVVGEGEGAYYVEIKDGQLFIEPYEYYDRDAMFTATIKVFNDIMDGKLDPVWAFTTHKLKVEGNFDKALKINELIQRVK